MNEGSKSSSKLHLGQNREKRKGTMEERVVAFKVLQGENVDVDGWKRVGPTM